MENAMIMTDTTSMTKPAGVTNTASMMDTATLPAAALPMSPALLNQMKPERIQRTFAWMPAEDAQAIGEEMRGWGVLSSKQLLLRAYRFHSLTEAAAFGAFIAAEANRGDHEVTMRLDGEQITVQLAPFVGNLLSEDELELARRIDREYRERKSSGRI